MSNPLFDIEDSAFDAALTRTRQQGSSSPPSRNPLLGIADDDFQKSLAAVRAAPRQASPAPTAPKPAPKKEQGWGEWAMDTLSKVPAAAKAGLLGLGEAGAKTNYAINDFMDTVTYPIDAGLATVGNMTGLFNYDPDEVQGFKRRYWQRGIENEAAKVQRAMPKAEGLLQEGILGGIQSAPTSLYAVGAGVLTRSPGTALGLMGVTTGAPAYTDARLAGKDIGTALKYGIEQGGTEVLTEKIPASSLIADVAKKTPIGKTLLKQLAEEIPGEQLATLIQDMSEWATLHPDKPVSQFIAERPSAAATTLLATITGTSIQTGAVAAVDQAGRLVKRRPGDNRVAPPGVVQTAVDAAADSITPQDEASPLDTADIARGRAEAAKAQAAKAAEGALSQFAMPKVGARVVIDHGDGQTEAGTLIDMFEDHTGSGVVIARDGKQPLREYIDTLQDAGVTIREAVPSPLAEADAIDARMAERARASGLMDGNPPVPPQTAQSSPGREQNEPAGAAPPKGNAGVGKPLPVPDGGAVIRSIFGDKARITSTFRSGDHPLSKANPKSWHTKSHAAVDIAPIPGMTFDQAKAAIEAQGFTLIEALNEVGKGRTKHATGDHWHFVIASGGAQVATTGPAAPAATVALPQDDAVTVPRTPVAMAEPLPASPHTAQDELAQAPTQATTAEDGQAVAPTVDAIPQAETNRAQRPATIRADRPQAPEAALPDVDLRTASSPIDVAAAAPTQIQPRAEVQAPPAMQQPTAPASTTVEDTARQAPEPERVDAPTEGRAAGKEPASSSAIAEQYAPKPSAASQVRVEPTKGGKSVAVIGADSAAITAISQGVPQAKAIVRADGARVYSAKHAEAIRKAIAEHAAAKRVRKPASARKARNPVDMLKFVARNGGVSYDGLNEASRSEGARGHDLRNTGGLSRFVPGAGPLLRLNGKSLDQMGELLWEAGYFGPPETTPRPDENTIIAELERITRTGEKRYSFLDDQHAVSRIDNSAEAEATATEDAARASLDVRAAWDNAAQRLGMEPLFANEIDEMRQRGNAAKVASLDPNEADPDRIANYMVDVANAELDDVFQDSYYEVADALYANLEEDFARATAAQGGAREDGSVGRTTDAGNAPTSEERGEDGRASAEVDGNPLDSGEATDPNIAERQRQKAQLRAEAPLRGANRTGQEQDGTMGMGLFDAADQPEMNLGAGAQTSPSKAETRTDEPKKGGDQPAAPIDDFGEELTGARKHVWQATKDRLTDAQKLDIQTEPLSKSWPEPNYQKLIDDGADPYVVAAMRAMRDAIPNKPRSYGVVAWGKQVEALRDAAIKMLEDGGVAENFMQKLQGDFSRSLRDLQGAIDLYREFGHARSFKGIGFAEHFYMMYRGEKNVRKWVIDQKQKATAFSNWPRELAVGDTRQEVLDTFRKLLSAGVLDKKRKDTVRFDIYSYRTKDGFWIGKKVGKHYIDLKRFDTSKEARTYKIEHYEELVAELAKRKEIPPERKQVNSPRIGINHRDGVDVTPEQFSDAFGFRGVQFGNYVEGSRRQEDLNEAYDALMDLAGVIGVPAKALSLNGALGLAFGARGKGGKNAASAHFESGSVVINLTKKRGAGSLAHEWWHSLDNYFARQRGNGDFVTSTTGRPAANMRPEMAEAFQNVMTTIRQTALKERSRNLDKLRTKDYWSTDVEMSARAFESYVIAKLADEQFSNDYLANIVPEAAFGIENGYPYLTAAEIPAVRAGFDAFFQTVETEQTDKGVRLFSLPEGNDDLPLIASLPGDVYGKLPPPSKERMLYLTEQARAWYRGKLQGRTVVAADGKPLTFGSAGRGKSTQGKGDVILRVIPALEDLITKGRVIAMADRDDRPHTHAVMFAGGIEIDGTPHRVGAIARIDDKGRYHYDLTNQVRKGSAGDPESSGGTGKASTPDLEDAASAELNLFLLDDKSKVSGGFDGDQANRMAQVEADLRQRLDALGLKQVKLRIVENMRKIGGAQGQYWPGRHVIEVALDAQDDTSFVLHHEALHALRDLGVFNKSDWHLLAAAARRDRDVWPSVNRRYRDLTLAQREEEAVADMFGRYQAGHYSPKGTIERIFMRIVRFLSAVRNGLHGQGFRSTRTFHEVFGEVAGGRAATHAGIGDRGAFRDTADARVFHGSPHDFGRFSSDAIGTGEGVQAYGWGLYFAGDKKVAEHYRTGLSRRQLIDFARDSYDEYYDPQEATDELLANPDLSDANRELLAALQEDDWLGFDYPHQAVGVALSRQLDNYEASDRTRAAVAAQGRLFEVDVPEDHEYLSWDNSLYGQPRNIQLGIAQALERRGYVNSGIYQDLIRGSGDTLSVNGGQFYEWMSRQSGSPREASLALRDAGIAGTRYLDGKSRRAGEGTYNYVIFDDSRVQVVAKQSRPEASDMVMLGGSDPTWKGKMGDAYDRWRTALQDRYLPLLKVQREIEQQTGRALPERLNPYVGEELMTGRIGARLETLSDDMVGPLFDDMAQAHIGVDELETYLYARHAPERNARIAEINPELPEAGSGMTDLEAKAVMNRIRKAGKMEAMERLAAQVDAIRDLAVDARVESGLMSKEDAETWRKTYKHYVPLRGFAETDGDPASAARINRSGGGINVRGKESRSAFGRRSKADSPLAYLILQAEEAIVRGETNRVAKRFVDLAQANPDPDFWTVDKVTERRRMNADTGLVERYTTEQLLAEDKDWTVSAKFDGVERRVTMSRANPAAARLADSMRNLTQQQLDWVTMHLGKVNRFLSSVNTSYNPEFVITNAFRDLQTAAVNMAGLDVDGLVGKTLRDYRKALVAATKGSFGKSDGEWGRWYDEFVDEGGRIFFNNIEDVGQIKKRIESTFAMAAAKQGDASLRLHVKRGLLAARDMIESLNGGVENAIRLAAYKNAREAGLSKEKAASLAKNLTVNFNRRGTAGPALNAAYMFFNASVQGSARIVKAMRSRKVRRVLGGVVVFGALLEMLNAMVSGDDDDGESFYDKIPDYEKSRNMIVMLPGGKEFIKIPLPYGYNAFFGAGRSLAEVSRRGGDRWQESAGNFLSTVIDAFNPVGGTESLLNFIAPTIADPIVDLTLNRDYTGRAIMPEQPAYDSPLPDFRRYWGSVSPYWRAVTDTLAEATGGDEITPGAIDVSPETLEYLSGVVLGAAGAFADRVASLPAKIIDPDTEVSANDFPFYRKVLGNKAAWVDKSAYYDRINTVDLHVDRTKDYLDAGLDEQARTYADKHEAILLLEPAVKSAQKEMKAIRKARHANEAAHAAGEIDDAAYRAEKDVIADAERIVITDFNSQWVATVLKGD